MTLSQYLFKLMSVRILSALAVLLGMLQVLDLLDVTTQILERNLGPAGVAYYALLRLPRLIEQAGPLAVLAGSLFAFAKLAGDSATTAMRSSGVSAYRITVMALPAALLLTLALFAIGMAIAPRTDARLSQWWEASEPTDPAKKVNPVTFRVGDEVVVAVPRDPFGRSLEQETIYRRDDTGRLSRRTTARRAVYDGKGWQLIEPRFETVNPLSVSEGGASAANWSRTLTPGDVRTLAMGQTSVSPAEASRALAGGLSIRPRTFYDTQVQRGWAAPIACLVMLLLAAPTSMANFRGGGATVVVQSLASGLLFLVFDGAFTALGESGAAPPILAAWAAPVMFSALGMTILLYQEG